MNDEGNIQAKSYICLDLRVPWMSFLHGARKTLPALPDGKLEDKLHVVFLVLKFEIFLETACHYYKVARFQNNKSS
jgi:hypothetical protein